MFLDSDDLDVGHSHASFATIEKSSDGTSFVLKALKQKQMIDGLYFLLQEIYGIENKSPERQKVCILFHRKKILCFYLCVDVIDLECLGPD